MDLTKLLELLLPILSVDTRKARRKRAMGKWLVHLHELVERIVENSESFLALKPSDPVTYGLPIERLETQAKLLDELREHLRETKYLRVLNLSVPSFRDVSVLAHAKVNAVSVLLATLYGFRENEQALAEVKEFESAHRVDEHTISPIREVGSRHTSSLNFYLERDSSGEPEHFFLLHATPDHFEEASRIADRLRAANSELRSFLRRAFEIEELL